MLPGNEMWYFLFGVGHMESGPADEHDCVFAVCCLFVRSCLLPSLLSCDDGGLGIDGVDCSAAAATCFWSSANFCKACWGSWSGCWSIVGGKLGHAGGGLNLKVLSRNGYGRRMSRTWCVPWAHVLSLRTCTVTLATTPPPSNIAKGVPKQTKATTRDSSK